MPDDATGTAPIRSLRARAYRIPTDQPEADGTFAWNATTIVVAEVSALGITGLGYTYTDSAAAEVINRLFAGLLAERDAFAIQACWARMAASVRNSGRAGICSSAISAVDVSLCPCHSSL